MEKNKPLGGKWNFDKENQKSISKLKEPPKCRAKLRSDEITISTMVDVENCFPGPESQNNFLFKSWGNDSWDCF